MVCCVPFRSTKYNSTVWKLDQTTHSLKSCTFIAILLNSLATHARYTPILSQNYWNHLKNQNNPIFISRCSTLLKVARMRADRRWHCTGRAVVVYQLTGETNVLGFWTRGWEKFGRWAMANGYFWWFSFLPFFFLVNWKYFGEISGGYSESLFWNWCKMLSWKCWYRLRSEQRRNNPSLMNVHQTLSLNKPSSTHVHSHQ